MTNRWKRLTALMLILLTLLNAGSALAAEEFWKWGDEFQRKNQKMIEESPSPALDDRTRKKMMKGCTVISIEDELQEFMLTSAIMESFPMKHFHTHLFYTILCDL